MLGAERDDNNQLSKEGEARIEGFQEDGQADAEMRIVGWGFKYDALTEAIPTGAVGTRRKLLKWKVRLNIL